MPSQKNTPPAMRRRARMLRGPSVGGWVSQAINLFMNSLLRSIEPERGDFIPATVKGCSPLFTNGGRRGWAWSEGWCLLSTMLGLAEWNPLSSPPGEALHHESSLREEVAEGNRE